MADDEDVRIEIRNHLLHVIKTIIRDLEAGNLQNDCLDSLEFRVDWLYSVVNRCQNVDIIDGRVVSCIREVRDSLQSPPLQSPNSLCQAGRIFTGERGRPRFQIPCTQLQFLIEKGFTVREIAQLFGTSTSTVERRMSEFGLSIRDFYAQLSDLDLDATVSEVMREIPNVGCKRMTGLLLGRGLRLQQVRIRESMRRVNPEGVLLRALELNILQRRCYQVRGPLSLWHIDGNHKLIRYESHGMSYKK